MKIAFFLFLFTSILFSFTGDKKTNSLEAHLFSYHTNQIYNNKNYGIGFNHRFNESFDVNLGYYKNSQGEDSFYGGSTYYFFQNNNIELGAGIVFATGYSSKTLESKTTDKVTYRKDCETNWMGDVTCQTFKVTSKKTSYYDKYEYKKIIPIAGLTLSYKVDDNVFLKMVASTTRGTDSKENETDLLHFSVGFIF